MGFLVSDDILNWLFIISKKDSAELSEDSSELSEGSTELSEFVMNLSELGNHLNHSNLADTSASTHETQQSSGIATIPQTLNNRYSQ